MVHLNYMLVKIIEFHCFINNSFNISPVPDASFIVDGCAVLWVMQGCSLHG